MMIANRFREVVWTGGICAAALSFYMVSQTVAAKRAELTGVERKIAATNDEIRDLRTEIDTRGGLAQIESWNQRVYGLQAPGAGQFADSSIRLVAMTQPQASAPALQLDPAIVASHGAVNQINLNVIEDGAMGARPVKTVAAAAPPPQITQPQMAQAQIGQPALRQANFVQAKPSALAPATASPVHEIADRRPAKAAMGKAALGDDFLADLGDEGATVRTRKVRP